MQFPENKIRPRKRITEAWANQLRHPPNHSPLFTIPNNLNYMPVYDKHNRFMKQINEIKQENPESPPSITITGAIKNFAHEYFRKCSLHGLKYVGDPDISLCEKIFWLISFLSALCFAAYFITILYLKWYDSPVIVSFNPKDAHIKDIPFPSITICSMNQASKEAAEDIVKNGPEVERHLLADYCNSDNTFENESADGKSTEWDYVFRFLLKVSTSCDDILRFCRWQLRKMDCNVYFNSELTDEGLCCSFNVLPPEYIFRNWKSMAMLNKTFPVPIYDWTPEKGFQGSVPKRAIPLRPFGAGAHLGLTIVLDAHTDDYYCSSTSSIGFKVLISNPIETPKMADFSFFLCPGIETRIVIEPVMSEATSTLRSIDVNKRKCYFADERILKFYRTYTERNCKLECQANYTLKTCGCVPYFLPKSISTKICAREQERCSNLAKEAMEKMVRNESNCNCLPGCFELNFKKFLSFAILNKKLKIKEDFKGNATDDYFVDNMAIVHFYFQNVNFKKTIKSELYGFSEFLSNTGGLLGLFLGFSFLSAVEILYFLTLRLICASLMMRKHHSFTKSTRIPFTR